MVRNVPVLVLAVVALLLAAALLVAAPGRRSPGREVEAELDRVVGGWAEANEVGAAILALRDGQTALSRAWNGGSLDDELTVGSASKWVSAAVALTLVDAGLMDLDAPLSRWLPELQGPAADITLRQALSHTSGMESRPACIRDYDISLRACVRDIAHEPLVHPPGAAFRYGSASYHAAGAAAEVAAGQPWRDIFRERLARPLGWERTRYGRRGRSENPGIAGNLTTTAREYARFLQMLLDDGVWEGRRILSADAVREMLAGQTGQLPVTGHVPRRMRRVAHPLYGLGLWRDTVGSDGELRVGSCDGRFGFVPWIDRERRIAAVFATEVHTKRLASKRPAPSRVIALVTEGVEGR